VNARLTCESRANEGENAITVNIDTAFHTHCLEIIRALPIPDPWDERDFLANLAIERNKPIELRPVVLPPGLPCGMLIDTPAADYIVRGTGLSALHAEHVDMHELGHLLLEHRAPTRPQNPTDVGGQQPGAPDAAGRPGRPEDAELDTDRPGPAANEEVAALSLLLPALDPEMIRTMLGRTAYADQQEWEAETFASLLMTHVFRRSRRARTRGLDLAAPLATISEQRHRPTGRVTSPRIARRGAWWKP
jgi:hypothetical protein